MIFWWEAKQIKETRTKQVPVEHVVLVSGAGSPSVNGDYSRVEQHLAHASYKQKSGAHRLQWFPASQGHPEGWYILSGDCHAMYYSAGSLNAVPMSTWAVFGGHKLCQDGSDVVMVSGAGTHSVNGEYKRQNKANTIEYRSGKHRLCWYGASEGAPEGWYITEDDGQREAYRQRMYFSAGSRNFVSTSTWSVYNGKFSYAGVEPAPSVGGLPGSLPAPSVKYDVRTMDREEEVATELGARPNLWPTSAGEWRVNRFLYTVRCGLERAMQAIGCPRQLGFD